MSERPDPVVTSDATPNGGHAPTGSTPANTRSGRWNGRTTAVAAAVAVGIATVAGGGVAAAAPKVNASLQGGGPGGHGGPGGMGGMGGPGGMAGQGGPGGQGGMMPPGQQGQTNQQGQAGPNAVPVVPQAGA